MTDLRKAAEQALESLERLDKWLALRYGNELTPPEREVVKALRQALQPKLEWFPAPTKTEWGEMMVKTSIEIDADHYFDVYCEQSQKQRVEQMLGGINGA